MRRALHPCTGQWVRHWATVELSQVFGWGDVHWVVRCIEAQVNGMGSHWIQRVLRITRCIRFTLVSRVPHTLWSMKNVSDNMASIDV